MAARSSYRLCQSTSAFDLSSPDRMFECCVPIAFIASIGLPPVATFLGAQLSEELLALLRLLAQVSKKSEPSFRARNRRSHLLGILDILQPWVNDVIIALPT